LRKKILDLGNETLREIDKTLEFLKENKWNLIKGYIIPI
jgi:hypothetical protein